MLSLTVSCANVLLLEVEQDRRHASSSWKDWFLSSDMCLQRHRGAWVRRTACSWHITIIKFLTQRAIVVVVHSTVSPFVLQLLFANHTTPTTASLDTDALSACCLKTVVRVHSTKVLCEVRTTGSFGNTALGKSLGKQTKTSAWHTAYVSPNNKNWITRKSRVGRVTCGHLRENLPTAF